MKKRHSLLPLFAALLTLLIAVSCASIDRVDRLEQDIHSLQTQVSQQMIQQQSTEADVAQRLSLIDEGLQSANQRLSSLETSASELSTSDDEMNRQISAIETKLDELSSEVEERFDDRAINEVLKNPLTYLVAIAILLLGLALGLWVSYCRNRRQEPVKAIGNEIQEETVEDAKSQNT